MMVFQLFIVLGLLPVILSVKEDYSDTHPCQFNLEEICGFQSLPSTQSQIYHARMCLGSNKNLLSGACYDYLNYESPSFIETCGTDILKYCKDLPVIIDDIQTCLKERGKEVNVDCQEALEFHKTDVLPWAVHNSKPQFLPELINSDALLAPLLPKGKESEDEDEVQKKVGTPELTDIVTETNQKIARLRKRNY